MKREGLGVGAMAAWMDGARDNPEPCKESDIGKFEIVARDGCARIGKMHTAHGVLDTPALLPVINPNIRTIEPREMGIDTEFKDSSPTHTSFGSMMI